MIKYLEEAVACRERRKYLGMRQVDLAVIVKEKLGRVESVATLKVDICNFELWGYVNRRYNADEFLKIIKDIG